MHYCGWMSGCVHLPESISLPVHLHIFLYLSVYQPLCLTPFFQLPSWHFARFCFFFHFSSGVSSPSPTTTTKAANIQQSNTAPAWRSGSLRRTIIPPPRFPRRREWKTDKRTPDSTGSTWQFFPARTDKRKKKYERKTRKSMQKKKQQSIYINRMYDNIKLLSIKQISPFKTLPE